MIGARSGTVPRRFDAPGQRHPPRPLVDQLDHVLRRQLAGRRIERGEDVLRAGLLAGEAPRRDVGVVVEARADDAVARSQRRGHGPRHGERQRRHVRPEADARRVGAEQLPDDRSRPVEQRVALDRGGEGAAARPQCCRSPSTPTRPRSRCRPSACRPARRSAPSRRRARGTGAGATGTTRASDAAAGVVSRACRRPSPAASPRGRSARGGAGRGRRPPRRSRRRRGTAAS